MRDYIHAQNLDGETIVVDGGTGVVSVDISTIGDKLNVEQGIGDYLEFTIPNTNTVGGTMDVTYTVTIPTKGIYTAYIQLHGNYGGLTPENTISITDDVFLSLEQSTNSVVVGRRAWLGQVDTYKSFASSMYSIKTTTNNADVDMVLYTDGNTRFKGNAVLQLIRIG